MSDFLMDSISTTHMSSCRVAGLADMLPIHGSSSLSFCVDKLSSQLGASTSALVVGMFSVTDKLFELDAAVGLNTVMVLQGRSNKNLLCAPTVMTTGI